MVFPFLTSRIALRVTLPGACLFLLSAAPRATPTPGPAYLLVALPSHQVVAESRRVILDTPIAPGSVMKVVTLAAALEHGVADAGTRILCRRTIDVDGRTLTCVHHDFHRALDPIEALGHSCNVFFATIARRLPRSALDDMLVRVGLAPSNPGTPLTTAALGLGGVRITPRALLDAFCRLTNADRVDLQLKDGTRHVLRLGLESAMRTGTASALAEAGYTGLAKTGTAPMPGGGYQGLVAAVIGTEAPTHAIIVVAPGGTGAHAASLAAGILFEHHVPRRVPGVSRSPGRPGLSDTGAPGGVRSHGPSGPGSSEAQLPESVEKSIRVGIARRTGGYERVDLPIEDYVARAVAGEGGDALPVVALEALAVTIRTYARANGNRHQADGFDVCDLTHCLSLRTATVVSDAAARATAGLIVVASNGRAADVYLSAWCGGYTEQPSQVWAGAVDYHYLPARLDPACGNDPEWTSEITEPQLRRVLQAAGLRGTMVGGFRAAVRSPAGRVRTLLVDGMQPPEVEGGVFRFAAGRTLGWQTIKSTMFDVVRTGTGYLFTGKGHGHGVGLCVRGAAARARTGGTREQILAAYFPGLSVDIPGPAARSPVPGRAVSRHPGVRSLESRSPGSLSAGSSPRLHSGRADPESGLSASSTSESPQSMNPVPAPQLRVVLPESDRSQLPAVRTMAERALAEVATTLGVIPPANVEIRFHPTVEAYMRATGQPWWTSGRTLDTRIDLLPLGVLTKRAIVETTIKHECVHVLTDSTLAGRSLWIREGLAEVVAGEFANVTQDVGAAVDDPNSRCPSDAELRAARSPDAWRHAYRAAAACVSRALSSGRRWQDLR